MGCTDGWSPVTKCYYTNLASNESRDYEKVKATLLLRYEPMRRPIREDSDRTRSKVSSHTANRQPVAELSPDF